MDDKTTDTSPSDKEYPEGGWGWVVCAASFMAWFIVFGVHNCFGIIYSSLINELNMGKAESGNIIIIDHHYHSSSSFIITTINITFFSF